MSAAVDRVLDHLAAAGCEPRKNGQGWTFRCPAHADRRPSGKLDVGGDGRALVKCHAGCELEALLDRIGLAAKDLFADSTGRGSGHVPDHPRKRRGAARSEAVAHPPSRRIVAAYDYQDEGGELRFQVVRFEPKDFRQRRPDGRGGWTWNMADTRRVLYRLPAVLAAVERDDTVYVVEGEKDADCINALPDGHHVATTNPGGAGKWKAEYSESLRGARVVIVQDRDDPGRQHAAEVGAALRGIAASVRIVEAAEGKDASDHLAAGFGLHELVAVEAPEADDVDGQVTAAAILDPDAGKLKYAVQDFLAEGLVTLFAATWKTAKTFVAYTAALEAAIGRDVLGHFPVVGPKRVLVLQFEMPRHVSVYRFLKIGNALDMTAADVARTLDSGSLVVLHPTWTLDTAEGLAAFRDRLSFYKPDVLVVDSLGGAFRSTDLNDATAARAAFDVAFRSVTKQRVAVLLLHHRRKRSTTERRGAPADGDSVLGSQAWPAAAGSVYTAERILSDDDDETEATGAFRVRLVNHGAWYPGDWRTLTVEVGDVNAGAGTSVRVVPDSGQGRVVAVSREARAAEAVLRIVLLRRRVSRTAVVQEVAEDLHVAPRTVERGIGRLYAEGKVLAVCTDGRRRNEVDLIPVGDEPCET